MTGVFTEIVAEIGPAPTDADHHSLSVLADSTDEQFQGRIGGGSALEVVESDLGMRDG